MHPLVRGALVALTGTVSVQAWRWCSSAVEAWPAVQSWAWTGLLAVLAVLAVLADRVLKPWTAAVWVAGGVLLANTATWVGEGVHGPADVAAVVPYALFTSALGAG